MSKSGAEMAAFLKNTYFYCNYQFLEPGFPWRIASGVPGAAMAEGGVETACIGFGIWERSHSMTAREANAKMVMAMRLP